MILLRALKWLIGYLVRFWICAFTKGLPAAFAMGYGEGELWASAMRRKYGVQGGDSTGQREVIEPDLCEEEEDSEDDRPGLELAPLKVTVRLISATATAPAGNGTGRTAITVRK
jgi:hypothetical protein